MNRPFRVEISKSAFSSSTLFIDEEKYFDFYLIALISIAQINP